jgi:hypothetical protein
LSPLLALLRERVECCVVSGASTVSDMRLSGYAMDRFVAPEMSKFTTATMRDMSAVDSQQEHWLANFILNTILRINVNSPQRQQLFNFLRRSHSAFAEYGLARESTNRLPRRAQASQVPRGDRSLGTPSP